MITIPCQLTGCEYVTPEASEAVALAMYDVHQKNHMPSANLQTTSTNQTDRTEKVKKPPITKGSTPEDWSYFECRWKEYKELTNIKENNLVVNLMECCEEELRKDIFRTYGSLMGNTEKIKKSCSSHRKCNSSKSYPSSDKARSR